jgi:hypothetical protein
MNVKEAMAEVRKLGMVLSRTEHGEFRVNFKGGSEDTAYYTDDLGDAVGTAKAMKKRRQPEENGYPISMKRQGALVGESGTMQHDASVGGMKAVSVRDADGKTTVYFFKNSDDAGRFHAQMRNSDAKAIGRLNVPHGMNLGELHKLASKQFPGGVTYKMGDKTWSPSSSRGAFCRRFAVGEVLDRVSDHLEALRQYMPREASNLRGIALRLDRVSNTLEAEEEVIDRVSKIESELDNLGVDFTVAPNSSDKQATCIFAYRGQLNTRDEAAVLGRIAKQYGGTVENGSRAYKITIPHSVGG